MPASREPMEHEGTREKTAGEAMRCPFRRGKDEEFALCYGASCMAYCEYDQPVISYELHREGREEDALKPHITTCKMMTMPGLYAGGYAI